MSEKTPIDSQIFFSSNVVAKFRTKLDTSNYSDLLGAGLTEMFDEGVALELKKLHDPYVVVTFPKTSPSVPLEMMITVLPLKDAYKARSSLTDFSTEDAFDIIKSAEKLSFAVKETALSNGHEASDSFVFQHFNPYDLNPKSMFNGSVSHFHLHIQLHGPSLSEFPKTFTPSGKLRYYEGSSRLLRDSGVSIFFELLAQRFPDLKPIMRNNGCVGFSQKGEAEEITQDEVKQVMEILRDWDAIWKEFARCFVTTDNETQKQILLPTEERVSNMKNLLEKFTMSEKNQKLLLFLAHSIKDESEDVWRNFYQGPNGAIGFHLDHKQMVREWLFAPRVFRSWSRQLPLISTKDSPITEWTTKNESGDGLINTEAKAEIYNFQRQVIARMKDEPS